MGRRNSFVTPPSSRTRRTSTSSSGSLRSALGYASGMAAATGNPMTAEVLSGASMMVDMFTDSATQTSSKRNMGALLNSQAGKASATVKGKQKGTKKVKAVKVSKTLRKKVQKVIDGGAYKGTYLTDKQMYVDFKLSSNSVADGFLDFKAGQSQVGAYAGNISNTFIPTGISSGRVCQWWSCGQAGLANTVPAGYDFTHFSPLKILDAASVLWNRKRKNSDYSFGGGNFTIDANISTGAVATGTNALPAKKNFKIHIDSCYTLWNIKNLSQRRMLVTFFHCTPKQKYANETPLNSYVNSLIQEGGGTPLESGGILEGKNAGSTINGFVADHLFNPSVQPKHIPSFNNAWNYHEVKVNIGPGETHAHQCHGPKNYDLDFAKLWEGQQDKGGFHYKNTTVSTMIRMELDQTFARTTGEDAATQYAPVSYPSQLGVNQPFQCPLAITLSENYYLRCPKISGFIQQATAAGSTQMLNLNKRSFAALNVGSVPTNPTYAILGKFDEENPEATIGVSGFV